MKYMQTIKGIDRRRPGVAKACGLGDRFGISSVFQLVLLSCFAASSAQADLDDNDVTNLIGSTGDSINVCGTVDCDADDGTNDTGEGSGKAIFTIYEVGPTGSGLINPFLRFAHNEQSGNGNDTIERAYNTDNDDLQSLMDPTGTAKYDYENQAKDTVAGGWKDGDFNRAILYDDLLAEGGYFTFLLDINEPNAEGKSTLRLDELSFFISDTNMLGIYDPQLVSPNNSSTPANPGEELGDPLDPLPGCDSTGNHTAGSAGCFHSADNGGADTEKVWDMDLDPFIGSVMLDNENDGTAGSGDYDLEVKLPTYVFDQYIAANGGSTEGLYVYLENTAGMADFYDDTGTLGGEAEANFEEWAFIAGDGGTDVPVPGTLLLMGLGLMLLGWYGRRMYI